MIFRLGVFAVFPPCPMKAASLFMYGPSNIFGNHMRALRLASRCRSLSCWLCLFLALPAPVMAFPWTSNAVDFVRSTRYPSRWYTESEILSFWRSDPRFTVPASFSGTISDVYTWLENNDPYHIQPPVLCVGTNLEYPLDIDESYVVSTNQLVAVGIAPTIEDSFSFNSGKVFPWFLASWYGFGNNQGNPYLNVGASPAFCGSLHQFGFFASNNMVVNPDSFQDWQEPGSLVWRRQDAPEYLNRSSAWFSGGTLRAHPAFYEFPELPDLGPLSERGMYPVSLYNSYSMLDEYWLPWYWQVQGGVVFWDDESDNIVIRNVWRFHSSSTNHSEGM